VKLIIGLGNPGEKYKNNRHNVGYLVIDKLSRMVNGQKLIAKKTNVFMNESGEVVQKMVDHYSSDINRLYIVHDDLDIRLGEYKIQVGRGPKDHKGLNSIYEVLGTKDFWHVRIGVDNRDSENRVSGEDYVLQDFTAEEESVLAKVINEVCKKLATF
jgi:PTH1 family peptidyl-tRNA hydrolase